MSRSEALSKFVKLKISKRQLVSRVGGKLKLTRSIFTTKKVHPNSAFLDRFFSILKKTSGVEFQSDAVSLVVVRQSSLEYALIANKFHQTLPGAHIQSIERVENPILYLQYSLRKLQMKNDHHVVDERLLFHCTKPDFIGSICEHNFNWRLLAASSYRGCSDCGGVTFFPNAASAENYFAEYSQCDRVMFLAKVRLSQNQGL